ncbi:MAG: helix-turn-helix domain-containing protein [Hoeflea sp.]|uniref:helix-turn-helix domain-containing protein n=1 Tax=Hoeflea sp. TaxID=1940281 RepID=UPI0032EF39C1
MNDLLITAEEAARRLDVSVATLSRWRRLRKHLPFLRVGNSYRYRPEDVEAAIERVEVAA